MGGVECEFSAASLGSSGWRSSPRRWSGLHSERRRAPVQPVPRAGSVGKGVSPRRAASGHEAPMPTLSSRSHSRNSARRRSWFTRSGTAAMDQQGIQPSSSSEPPSRQRELGAGRPRASQALAVCSLGAWAAFPSDRTPARIHSISTGSFASSRSACLSRHIPVRRLPRRLRMDPGSFGWVTPPGPGPWRSHRGPTGNRTWTIVRRSLSR